MPPPKHVPFREAPAPEEGTPRVSRELRGAKSPRIRREKGADCTPPHEEDAPDEPADVRLPTPKLLRRFEISYRAPEWASNREGGRGASGDKKLIYVIYYIRSIM